jgi:iron(III) transport system substrate-binding protein
LALQANLPVGVVYPDQGPRGMGVLVNPNAVAIVKGSKNPNQAKRFVDFLLSKPAQELLVKHAFEIPLLPGIDPGPVRPLSGLKVLQINQERLADLEDRTITLFPGL